MNSPNETQLCVQESKRLGEHQVILPISSVHRCSEAEVLRYQYALVPATLSSIPRQKLKMNEPYNKLLDDPSSSVRLPPPPSELVRTYLQNTTSLVSDY